MYEREVRDGTEGGERGDRLVRKGGERRVGESSREGMANNYSREGMTKSYLIHSPCLGTIKDPSGPAARSGALGESHPDSADLRR